MDGLSRESSVALRLITPTGDLHRNKVAGSFYGAKVSVFPDLSFSTLRQFVFAVNRIATSTLPTDFGSKEEASFRPVITALVVLSDPAINKLFLTKWCGAEFPLPQLDASSATPFRKNATKTKWNCDGKKNLQLSPRSRATLN
jgi:hypothetical protein